MELHRCGAESRVRPRPRAVNGRPADAARPSVPPACSSTLTALAFGVAALILFIFAFSGVFTGRIGSR